MENSKDILRGKKVILRKKRLEDAAADYAWKRDAELAHLDATVPLQIPFSQYLLDYAEELRFPDSRRRRFAIETLDGKHIGNCSYYDINEYKKEAELGIIIGDRDYWDKGYGADAVSTLVNHIFQETRLERIYLHTLEENIRAQKCFQKCGFVSCGRVIRGWHTFVRMEIRREQQKGSAGCGQEANLSV
jgi:RimJ/RimL family protein N-acetyltransferase